MVGLRGLPATRGGIERHVEEVGARLVAAGHLVDAFRRPPYTDSSLVQHSGIGLRTPRARGVGAFVHSALSSLATPGHRFDVGHFHALGTLTAEPQRAVDTPAHPPGPHQVAGQPHAQRLEGP